MENVDVKLSTCIDSSNKSNDKDPKFEIGDIVRMSKYKNFFAKGYVPNQSEEFLQLEKLKTLCRGQILLVIIKGKKFLEGFANTNCKKKKSKVFRVEKVIKRKGHKLYVKWKSYYSSLDSWINKLEQYWTVLSRFQGNIATSFAGTVYLSEH